MLTLIHYNVLPFFSGDIYLSFAISSSSKLFGERNFSEYFEAFVNLPGYLLPIKLPVPSAV